jgi:hypothetical protein
MKPDPATKAVLAVLALMLTLSACGSGSQSSKPQTEIPFDRMTPAQHLAKAKEIMTAEDPSRVSQDQIKEATRHLSAIPDTAPEHTEAVALRQQSTEAGKEKSLETVRRKYTNDLEKALRQQGFDFVVAELGDQLILENALLKDEDNRVEFLTTIRKIRDAQGLCDVGFRRAALGEKGSLSGTHVYSLDCKAKK